MNPKNIALALMGLVLFTSHAQKRIPEVEQLLQKMTLEEKIGQLNLLTPGGEWPQVLWSVKMWKLRSEQGKWEASLV